MTNLQKSILVLLAHMSILFLLGWTKMSSSSILDLGQGFYIFIIGAILATIGIPFIRKTSIYLSLIAWTFFYMVYRLVGIQQQPLFGGIETYHTLIEIALLSISIFLAFEVARNLKQTDDTLARVMLPDLGNRIMPMEDASKDIAAEFVRARRHNRPLALVVIEPAEGSIKDTLTGAVHQIQATLLERYMVSSIAKVIGEEARRIDLIVQPDENGKFVILCPETSAEGSTVMANRIQETVREQLGINVHYGFATFPEQALTFDEILARAENNLTENINSFSIETEESTNAR